MRTENNHLRVARAGEIEDELPKLGLIRPRRLEEGAAIDIGRKRRGGRGGLNLDDDRRFADENALALIAQGVFDVSPGVAVGEDSCYLDIDGDRLLVEGEPTLIDHIALVSMLQGNAGVWQRDRGPGVIGPQSTEAEVDASLEKAANITAFCRCLRNLPK
jgi:hypothetical protein